MMFIFLQLTTGLAKGSAHPSNGLPFTCGPAARSRRLDDTTMSLRRDRRCNGLFGSALAAGGLAYKDQFLRSTASRLQRPTNLVADSRRRVLADVRHSVNACIKNDGLGRARLSTIDRATTAQQADTKQNHDSYLPRHRCLLFNPRGSTMVLEQLFRLPNALPFSGKGLYVMVDSSTAGAARRPPKF